MKLMWRDKITYSAVRPLTSIRHAYVDKDLQAWVQGKGTQTIKGQDWNSYLRTMPHAGKLRIQWNSSDNLRCLPHCCALDDHCRALDDLCHAPTVPRCKVGGGIVLDPGHIVAVPCNHQHPLLLVLSDHISNGYATTFF